MEKCGLGKKKDTWRPVRNPSRDSTCEVSRTFNACGEGSAFDETSSALLIYSSFVFLFVFFY